MRMLLSYGIVGVVAAHKQDARNRDPQRKAGWGTRRAAIDELVFKRMA